MCALEAHCYREARAQHGELVPDVTPCNAPPPRAALTALPCRRPYPHPRRRRQLEGRPAYGSSLLLLARRQHAACQQPLCVGMPPVMGRCCAARPLGCAANPPAPQRRQQQRHLQPFRQMSCMLCPLSCWWDRQGSNGQASCWPSRPACWRALSPALSTAPGPPPQRSSCVWQQQQLTQAARVRRLERGCTAGAQPWRASWRCWCQGSSLAL